MLEFFFVHVEEVHICIGVPITAPIGEGPLLANRVLIIYFYFFLPQFPPNISAEKTQAWPNCPFDRVLLDTSGYE